MDSQEIPVSPALQRLGEEFQAMYGERLGAPGAKRGCYSSFSPRVPFRWTSPCACILACDETATLERWAEAALTAGSIDAVFVKYLVAGDVTG
ncbi:MAG: hypothetical protein Q8S73_05450 [Deltaproteobacteria bacterium]|nr:hypothetical protein [Myxococcales bacterium]MDP3213527.1 hypothetical protein [Deltaproteobacteria bacterium]